MRAGSYLTSPFANPGSDACYMPPQPTCTNGANDDEIQLTFTVPDGWTANGLGDISREWRSSRLPCRSSS